MLLQLWMPQAKPTTFLPAAANHCARPQVLSQRMAQSVFRRFPKLAEVHVSVEASLGATIFL